MIKPGVLLNGDYRNVLPFDQDKIRGIRHQLLVQVYGRQGRGPGSV